MLSRIRVFPHVLGALFVAGVLAFALTIVLGGSGSTAGDQASASGGAPAVPQGPTGDDRCPPRVPAPAVPKRVDPKDRPPERTHSTDGDGPAPVIRWQDAADHGICVTWKQPSETGGRVPAAVNVAVHAIYGLFPA